MGLRTLSNLKNVNRTFDNVLDSVQLNLIENETISAARTLTNEDSGKVFFVSMASAYDITLPLMSTITSGWNAKFIISVADTNAVNIINNSAEDTIVGMVATAEVAASADASATAESAVDSITFISGAQLGDTVTIISNGTNYFATGMAHDIAHIEIV